MNTTQPAKQPLYSRTMFAAYQVNQSGWYDIYGPADTDPDTSARRIWLNCRGEAIAREAVDALAGAWSGGYEQCRIAQSRRGTTAEPESVRDRVMRLITGDVMKQAADLLREHAVECNWQDHPDFVRPAAHAALYELDGGIYFAVWDDGDDSYNEGWHVEVMPDIDDEQDA